MNPEDLIDWRMETTVYPEEFYCGSLDQCWALDAAYRDGKYYLYFSTGDWGVGVAVSDHPAGPFRDALRHHLVDYDTYPENIQNRECVSDIGYKKRLCFWHKGRFLYVILPLCKIIQIV